MCMPNSVPLQKQKNDGYFHLYGIAYRMDILDDDTCRILVRHNDVLTGQTGDVIADMIVPVDVVQDIIDQYCELYPNSNEFK